MAAPFDPFNRPPSPIRQKVLGNLSSAFGRPVGGWPEGINAPPPRPPKAPTPSPAYRPMGAAPTPATPFAPANPYTAPPAPAPAPAPTGGGGNYGQWSGEIDAAAREFGVPPQLLANMIQIESGGDPNAYRGSDGIDSAPAVGLMQVKPDYWGHLVPDADPYSPSGNIRLGAAIMAQGYQQAGSWEGAITNTYFPANDVNGTTQQTYVDQAMRGW